MSDSDDKTMLQVGDLNQAGSEESPEAKLICLDDSALPEESKSLVVKLKEDDVVFGRGGDSTVILAFKKVSRMHARVYPSGDGWGIEDLKSTNGVWINNKRITNSLLASGDTVTIGSIPFRYELVRPEIEGVASEVDEEPSDEKTMLFGDLGASDAMISASEKKDDEPEKVAEEKPVARPAARKAAPKATVNKPAKKGVMAKIVVLLLLLCAAGGGAYYYTSIYSVQQVQESLVRKNQKKIKNFVRDYEVYNDTFDHQSYVEEMGTLNDLLSLVQEGLTRYPDNVDLQAEESTVILLRLERQVAKLFAEGRESEVIGLIEKTEKEVLNYFRNGEDDKSSAFSRIKEVASLIDLLDITAKYQIFALKYPFPSVPSTVKITSQLKDDIIRIKGLKDNFSDLLKSNNKALRVTFKYMNGMVKHVDDQVLTLVEKWYHFIYKS
ncbi:FHA domain-containing protein [Maridesulfovibrio sp.]|uniref:FHA domain-containing protein n=1 Tax=Maridesulfovibrio sp. TaxID=2795000 RepID=UPI002AA654FD|nr:FHA domain-containing protein [Maridesulfovibrio sp.]